VIKPGPHGAPRDQPGSAIAGEVLLTSRGTLGLRGPMVPVAAYAPPPPPSDSMVAQPPRDYVDTDYAARLDRATGTINITAPPSGVSLHHHRVATIAADALEPVGRLGQREGPRVLDARVREAQQPELGRLTDLHEQLVAPVGHEVARHGEPRVGEGNRVEAGPGRRHDAIGAPADAAVGAKAATHLRNSGV
jgi:hypothetical protein